VLGGRTTLQGVGFAASTTQLRENIDVQTERNETRHKERHRGRVQHVARTAKQHAPVVHPARARIRHVRVGGSGVIGDVIGGEVVPAEQRREARYCRDPPDDGGVDEGVARVGAPLAAVPERVERGRESVERDDAKVPDGRRAEEDVDEQPDVAGGPSEHPATETLVDGRQRQDGDRQQKVAERQVADEQVGHVAETAEAQQREDDEQVAAHRGRDDGHERHGDDRQLRLIVVERQRRTVAGRRRASLSASRRRVVVVAAGAADVVSSHHTRTVRHTVVMLPATSLLTVDTASCQHTAVTIRQILLTRAGHPDNQPFTR